MIDRIIFFGCSITYGHGLPDCIIGECNPGDTHSNLGYPQLLGDRLGKKVINRSLPGSSNLRILNRILDFEFTKTDTVFIQWTIFNRSGVFSQSTESFQNIHEIRPYNQTKIARSFYEMHTDYDLVHKTMFDIHHANLFLKDKVGKLVNVMLVSSMDDTLHNMVPIPSWFDINLGYWKVDDITLDLANDNGHPGLISQAYMANLAEELVQENRGQSVS